MPKQNGWIGVDFDGTVAYYDHWRGSEHCGAPIKLMVDRVKKWIAEGREVRIFTARISPYAVCIKTEKDMEQLVVKTARHKDAIAAIFAIRAWCREHIGVELPITNIKDFAMIRAYDDRVTQVVKNTGKLIQATKD